MFAMSREFPELFPMGVLDAFKRTSAFRDAQKADAQTNGRLFPKSGRVGEAYDRIRSPQTSDVRYDAMRYYYERGGFA